MGMCIRVHDSFFTCFRAGLVAAAILLVTVLPAAAQEAVEVEPHWSPYTAPTTFEPDQQVYIIVRGDNLWNLAARFYSDPLLWPRIWDANRYVTDAHWIYPGDPLVIPEAPDVAASRMVDGEDSFGEQPLPGEVVDEMAGDPVPPDEMVDPEGGNDGGDAGIEGFDAAMESPGTLIHPVDVYCAPMILPDLDVFEHMVSGAEEGDKVSLAEGDVVYLDGGESDGITAGDHFFLLQKQRKVKHPDSGRNLGWAMRQVGVVEVLCANENDATALISQNCAEVHVGDYLLPWRDMPIPVVEATAPLGRCDEPAGGNDGYLVYNLDDQASVGEGNLVVMDKGSDDGVGAGDFFAVYRLQDGHQLMLGEAVVVRTERAASTVKINHSFREIHIGDRVALK